MLDSILVSPSPLLIHALPLSTQGFSSFGSVIEVPEQDPHNSSSKLSQPQGTAARYTTLLDNNQLAPFQRYSQQGAYLYVCRSRQVKSKAASSPSSALPAINQELLCTLPVTYLEQRLHASQTFIPLGESHDTRYLVVVAPSLPSVTRMRRSLASRVSGARPPPFPEKDKGKIISRRPPPFPEKEDSTKKTAQRHQLGGMPDLAHVQAFIARGDQAVTFSPGTWHAPMLVNGEKEIKFIVFMVGNGIPEAGNKVVINASGDELEGAIHVAVPGETASVTKSDTSKNLVQEKGERLWTKAKL